MNLVATRRAVIGRSMVAALTATGLCGPYARAQGGDPKAILKAMFDYVGSQKKFSLSYDSDIEVVTPELQKIQFGSSGQMLVSRPDKVRATRTGGYSDVEMIFDGKQFTVFDRYRKTYAQADAPGSIDQLVDRLSREFLIEAPGADLLLTNGYAALTQDVLDAEHIGQGVIDGTDCEHLAFREHETDWQLWVQVGESPIPRQYLIVSKTVATAPEYTLRIKDWKTDVPAPDDAFAFTPPAEAKRVDFKALANIDEVPAPTGQGAEK